MRSEIHKDRIRRFLQTFGVRVTSSRENKFSYDRANFEVGDAPVIFDVGANIGQTTLWFRYSFPNALIHSFEPFRGIYENLRANVLNPCHRIAFGDENTTLEVPISGDPYYQMGSLKHQDGGQIEAIEVRTVDSFCEEHGIERIDILKIDTEGYELEVLTGAKRMLKEGGIGYVLAEATLVSKRHTHLFALNDFLSPYGYSLISIFDGHQAESGAGLKYCNALFRLNAF